MQLRPMDICMIFLVTLTQTFAINWMSKLAELHIRPVKGMKQDVSHIVSICSATYSGKTGPAVVVEVRKRVIFF